MNMYAKNIRRVSELWELELKEKGRQWTEINEWKEQTLLYRGTLRNITKLYLE